MIRFIILNIFLVIHTIIFSLLSLILDIFDKKQVNIQRYSAVPWSKIYLRVCGIKIDVHGQKHFNNQRSYIYISNHQSYFDILALLVSLPVDFKFILKQELMQIPIFGAALKKAGYIGIERDNPRQAIKNMKLAANMAKNGISFLVFPEGTRNIEGKLQDFKKGGFKLAIKSNCDIIPITISNSFRIVKKDSLTINRGTIRMDIGKPVPISNYSRANIDDLIERVHLEISNNLKIHQS